MERISKAVENETRNLVIDCIGESVGLDTCPYCKEHPDCFSNISGRCCALKEGGGQECVFYKNREQAVAENKATYKKLKGIGRIDLIVNYGKLLSAVGAFSDEAGDAKFDRGAGLSKATKRKAQMEDGKKQRRMDSLERRGFQDPTADEAIAHVMREEKMNKKKQGLADKRD